MKKTMFAIMSAVVILAASCSKDLDHAPSQKNLVSGPTVDTLYGFVNSNLTLTRTTYLDGIVYVSPGVTLTINAGLTIIGGLGPVVADLNNLRNNKGTLVIERGAKIIANGSANQPIIWTSQNPVGSRHYGDWGGLILEGRATMHAANGNTYNVFEAFSPLANSNVARNRYGYGDTSIYSAAIENDNSGSIQYNRFEFGGGTVTVPNQEVNGVTMCAVGNGTTYSHNEVLYSGDDAIEFFGGAVNVDHMLAFQAHDDNYDEDEGYHGNMQFIIGYQAGNNDNSGSHLVETDNDASATNALPHTHAFIANATFIGPTVADNSPGGSDGFYYDGCFDVRRNSRLTFVNSICAAQQQPFVIVTTPTTGSTNAPHGLYATSTSGYTDSIVFAYNVFQTNSSLSAIALSNIEGNPTPLSSPLDVPVYNLVTAASFVNTAVTNLSDYKLGDYLENTSSSPTKTGGVDLNALGLTQFVGTTERGAVRTNDVWTNSPWISIANN